MIVFKLYILLFITPNYILGSTIARGMESPERSQRMESSEWNTFCSVSVEFRLEFAISKMIPMKLITKVHCSSNSKYVKRYSKCVTDISLSKNWIFLIRNVKYRMCWLFSMIQLPGEKMISWRYSGLMRRPVSHSAMCRNMKQYRRNMKKSM